MSSSDLTEGTVAPASLTFTVANWNTPQIDPNIVLYISLSLIFLVLALGMIMIARRKSKY